MNFTEKEERALKILTKQSLHEDDTVKLEPVIKLVANGLAQYLPFQRIFERGRWHNVRQIIITEKGRQFYNDIGQ